jgi:UDP-N-acetylmuramate: L-alanyl-gamma-D-glutamyl-meso-diaminopimelate ligase
MPQAIHFISIGGSVMHNLAITLQQQGFLITGSDDEIHDPAYSRLQQHGLLPDSLGWAPEKIHADLQAVILGMHARSDNPELIQAQTLGIPVYSYPEYIYRQSRQKQRVVIAGSHGKSTITAMILHALKHHNRQFDYLIGEPVAGLESTVRVTAGDNGSAAPIIIIEGDEYASSAIDPQAKFLHYQPHIALINGIAWDHVTLYPTWEEYVDQFELLAEDMPKAGILVFDESDDMLDVIGQKDRADITKIPYKAHPSERVDGRTYLITKQKTRVPVQLFGEHNMKNIAGAMVICDRIGITEEQFYEAIPTFPGVISRLEKIAENGNRIVFRDAARAPSKVEAATEAVKNQFPGKRLLAVVELPAFSSLNSFLDQYHGCFHAADEAFVFSPASATGQLAIDSEAIKTAFGRSDLSVFTDPAALRDYLIQQRNKADIFLLMSSNNFNGLDVGALANELL